MARFHPEPFASEKNFWFLCKTKGWMMVGILSVSEKVPRGTLIKVTELLFLTE